MTDVMTGGSMIVTPTTPTRNIANERAKVDEQYDLDGVDPIGRMEVLIYGPPKGGKTVIASTFPGPFRWLAADGRSCLKSVKWAVKEGKASFTDPKFLVAYSPRETPKGSYIAAPNAYNLMQDMIAYWFSPEQVTKWETLVLDSFTEINIWALDLGLSLNQQYPTSARPLSTSDSINRKAMTRLITGKQDYKSAMGLIEGFLRNVRTDCAKHNKNLVILCHEWQNKEENSDGEMIVTSVRPLLLGDLREKVCKDFDDVWHMEKYNKAAGIEIKVRIHGDNKVLAGTRWGTIMTREVDPDYRTMIAQVKAFYAK